MNKKWFGFSVFMLVFSSITTFLYFVALYISPFIMIPGISKEMMTAAILVGIFIGTAMMYFSIKSLYRHGTKVTITPPKDIPPLDKTEFSKLCDDIKDTNIGQSLMNHVMECEDCKKKSLELNQQASKHVEEREKLT